MLSLPTTEAVRCMTFTPPSQGLATGTQAKNNNIVAWLHQSQMYGIFQQRRQYITELIGMSILRGKFIHICGSPS